MDKVSKRTKIILASIASLVFVAAVALAMLFILQQVRPDLGQSPEAAMGTSPIPENVIREYSESTTIGDRVTAYRKLVDPATSTDQNIKQSTSIKQVTIPTNTAIVYTPKDSYSTRINVVDYVQFIRQSKLLKDNSESIKNDTEAYLADKGMVEVKRDTSLPGITYLTYESKNLICQISDMDSTVYELAVYGVACALKTTIEAQYTQLQTLFALSNTPLDTLHTVIIDVNAASDDKKITTLIVTAKDKTTKVHIYAAIGDTWEYIGQKDIPNPDVASSYRLSDAVSQKISDPKWNGFLQQYITGSL